MMFSTKGYSNRISFMMLFFYCMTIALTLLHLNNAYFLSNGNGNGNGKLSNRFPVAFCPTPKYAMNRALSRNAVVSSSSVSASSERNNHNKNNNNNIRNANVKSSSGKLRSPRNYSQGSLLIRHSTMDETGVSDINDDGDDEDNILLEENDENNKNNQKNDNNSNNSNNNNRKGGYNPIMDPFEDLENLSLEELKIRLMEVVGGSIGKNKLLTTSSKRSKVNEILLKLESMNPTKKPSSSTLLNGVWDFLYTGGISPGLLGLQIALYASEKGNGAISLSDTYLTISRSQPRVEVTAKVNIFGRESTFNIQTNLEPESDVRLFETYVSATLNDAFTIPFPKPGNNNLPDPFRLFERSLFISYLDNDLLIVRDGFGAPDILTRKEMDFGSYTGEPSFSEDDLAPGAG